MTMSYDNRFRQSLPKGEIVTGEKQKYIIYEILYVSVRSMTAYCMGVVDGIKRRVKFYNGESALNTELIRKIMTVPAKGVILPEDMGEYSGRLFCIYPCINAIGINEHPISVDMIVTKIIPQLVFIINQYHKTGIILRDICPEHILYDPLTQKIAYCGFGNFALLEGKATVTKAPGYGQPISFLAPEVEKIGYSVYSDYFAFGVMLLCLLRGYNPMKNLNRQELLRLLAEGQVPGIDLKHLKTTPYTMYSQEDKVLYLILGLLQVSPKSRWGIREIRCWSNNQQIPLVSKNGRINYQFSEPFLITGKKYWNTKDIAQNLAKEKLWDESLYQSLISYMKRQGDQYSNVLLNQIPDMNSSAARLFYCIYILSPSLDGLWWCGSKYANTAMLVQEALKSEYIKNELSTMLRYNCLSFFAKSRTKVSNSYAKYIMEFEQIEHWEKEEPGKGVNRCIMRFSQGKEKRLFIIEGREYNNVDAFLSYYKNDGKKIKQLSKSIINDNGFQAWLWANGMESAGTEAVRIVKSQPDKSFFFLLSMCEELAQEENTKRLARKLYLKWGEFAPVCWLCYNVDKYVPVSSEQKILLETFKMAQNKLNDRISLKNLSHYANNLIHDYQTLVGNTCETPFELESLEGHVLKWRYYPLDEDGFFCCKWETYEVCPAFLKSVYETVDKQSISIWLEHGEKKERERLESILSGIPLDVDDNALSEKDYLMECKKNILSSIFMMVVAIVAFSVSIKVGDLFYSFIGLAVAVLFPIAALIWYYARKVHGVVWYRNQTEILNQRRAINEQIKSLGKRKSELIRNYENGISKRCIVAKSSIKTVSLVVSAPKELSLSSGLKVLEYISAYGYIMMCAVTLGILYENIGMIVAFLVLYGCIIPYMLTKGKASSSCYNWAIMMTILTAVLVTGTLMFGATSFIKVSVIAPIVIVIVVFVIGTIG